MRVHFEGNFSIFSYFTSTRDASKAKDQMQDAVIDGMKVRVDYSVTRGGGP